MFVEDKISIPSYRSSSSTSLHSTSKMIQTKGENDALNNPSVVKIIMKSQPLDADLVESVFQSLASDALSSFPDPVSVDREFAKLVHNYSHCALKKATTDVITVDNPVIKAAQDDKSLSVWGAKKNWMTKQEIVTDEHGVNGHGCNKSFEGLRRIQSVKEKRLLFEKQNQEMSHKRDHSLIVDKSLEEPLKKLKRQGSLKEKKNFWETIFQQQEEEKKAKENLKPVLSTIEGSVEIHSGPVTEKLPEISIKSEDAEPGSISDCPAEVTLTEETNQRNEHQTPEAKSCPQRLDTETNNRNIFDRSSFEIIEAEEAFALQLESSEMTEQTTSTVIKKKSAPSLKSTATAHTNDQNDILTSQSVGSACDAFIYDDFIHEEYSSYIGDDFSPKNRVSETQPEFKLSSRMGKMFGVDPEKCQAYGSGLSSGRVTFDNSFYVSTEGAGTGFVTVGIQGPTPTTVKRVTVEQEREDLFRITYNVLSPGYYIIFVKYGDCLIMGSPFVCQVADADALL